MPLYDLVCILRASAPRKAVAEVLRRAATTVLDANGVVTDIKNYGTRALAYAIRRTGEIHEQARIGPRRCARLGRRGGRRPARRPPECRVGMSAPPRRAACRCGFARPAAAR